MKVTKVEKTRIAVSANNVNGDGRGFLYPTPNEENSVQTVEKQLEKRVFSANKMYGVFFPSDIPRELEMHFCEIVKLAKNSSKAAAFIESAKNYKSCVDNRGNKYLVAKFNYGSGKKNIYQTLENHVRERMTDEWQHKRYCEAATYILACICDKDYVESIRNVSVDVMETFVEASKASKDVYLRSNTRDLERYFTMILKQVAGYKESDVVKKIGYLKQIKELSYSEKNRKTNTVEKKILRLSEIQYPYAKEERLKAMLTRMRKPLKRGTNGEVAIRLLEGLAQMEGKTLASVIASMQQTEKGNEALEKFITTVCENYHKTHIIRSIKNHDVKVQVNGDKLDLSSIHIEKVSSKKKNKVALSVTLERYATSKESASSILKEVKGVLLDYFMWKEPSVKEEFTSDDKLWKIPNRIEEFFDADFEPIDDRKDEKVEAYEDLAAIWSYEKVKSSVIKKRINYVNCGKYQQLIKNETDDIRKYWIGYVKDFIEKNYVTKEKKFKREDCYKTKMLLECWKAVLRFICGKYMDLGKAVYHFAMLGENTQCYGTLDEKYQQGISSFAYEAIKAEENIQRDIAKATVAATTAFTSSVLDANEQQKENLEDILFAEEDKIQKCAKEDEIVKKQLLRFYGGYSANQECKKYDSKELMKELLWHIKAIRNENFHFTKGKPGRILSNYTKSLWENEQAAYQQGIREKYYSNNVAMFYSQEKVCDLVQSLYREDSIAEAQIPAFRTIWQKKLLPEYINGLSLSGFQKNDAEKMVIFEGALYFLLKEIYYRGFIVSADAKKLFFKAVDAYVKDVTDAAKADSRSKEKKALANAGLNFKKYVDGLKKEENTFGKVCQFINTEYNQQNNGKQEEEIYKHFKMLLPVCVRKAFQSYIDQHYEFIKAPQYKEKTTEDYLQNIDINCMKMNLELAHWFTFAHFIHPRQLNFLVGNFKDYIQYRKDVFRRMGYAKQFANEAERAKEEEVVNSSVKNAEEILKILDFVRQGSGRVSNEWSDYYENQDEYVAYMSKYFEANVDLKKYDIYADDQNIKILRNVELARMYAGGDMTIPSYPKITREELDTYYKNKDEIAQIQSKGICKSKEQQQKVVEFQQLKGRITLNEVTDLFSMTNELLGNLVSLSYLRERDEMYLFLGFYYMALRHTEGWEEVLETEEIQGLVLNQTLAVFDFGTKLLYQNEDGRWEKKTGGKWPYFIRNHSDTYQCIIPLFEMAECGATAKETRNYVDHSKYYVNHKWSILDLYSRFYTGSFGYSSKLRKSVLFNLQSTLEKFYIEAKLQMKNGASVVLDREPKSKQFVYKYEDGATVKTININAKSQAFTKAVYELLKYKKEQ